MAASTSSARRLGAALIVLGVALLGCQLFERTEPQASQDVLDAIYDGIKRAQQHPS
jgi:hypothetical protein